MFTKFDKAITTLVLAVLALLSLIFKTDLSGYGEAIAAVIVALMPVVVYLVPNLKVVQDGAGGDAEKIVDAVTGVAGAVTKIIKK